MTPAARWKLMLWAPMCVGQALGGAACAADSSEVWPELSAYISMTPGTRLYLDTSYTGGKDSDVRALSLSAAVDISLKPILDEQLASEDWQRNRYFWTRLGYTRATTGTDASSRVAENRGVLALYGKAPLPAEVWLEARVQADLRWIEGDYSTRYRFRIEATREFTVLEHKTAPFARVEWFYDTRYDTWTRTLYEAGTEVTVNKQFRYEVYLARQVDDRRPGEATINALGLVAKWYF